MVAAIDASADPLVVSPFVVAELDYLVLTRHGSDAEHAVLAELGGGVWELAGIDRRRLAEATRLVEAYRDVPIDVTDAANIVLAQAYQTREIATLDRRNFTILRLDDGSAPRLLP
ncbi:hypothetical protein BJF86_05405 [Serinicoccus sp. CNJ-927]|nr:hypothetical protein BJF86_05405 [Serinicoccus sp. CNJ-927]